MIKPLTSLRFFFAFFVFLSHMSYLKEDKLYKDTFEVILSEGFLGVSFFFILSGFILALNYRDKFIHKTVTLKKFYIARFARIYPLHFVMMLVSIPIFYSGLKNLLYNILLIQSYVPNETIYFSYNSPSWSISDEVFFYLLFPFLIVIISKLGNVLKLIIPIVFISIILLLNIVLIEASKAHYWLYISPFVRVFEFILGIILFDVVLYIKSRRNELLQSVFNIFEIGAFLTFIIFFSFHNDISISYRYSIYYWFPMCLIILGTSSSFILEKNITWISKFLSSRLLVYLGEISFGFYLIHYLVIPYTIRFNGYIDIHPSSISFGLEIFIITIIASIFAFEVIEKPFNRKIKKLLS